MSLDAAEARKAGARRLHHVVRNGGVRQVKGHVNTCEDRQPTAVDSRPLPRNAQRVCTACRAVIADTDLPQLSWRAPIVGRRDRDGAPGAAERLTRVIATNRAERSVTPGRADDEQVAMRRLADLVQSTPHRRGSLPAQPGGRGRLGARGAQEREITAAL